MSVLFSLPRLATRWGVGRTDGWHFRLHWRRIRILELNFAGSFIRGRWRKCALKKLVEAERWRNGRHRQSDKTAARRKRKSCRYNSAGICWQVGTNSVSPSQEMAFTASCRLMGIECGCLRFFSSYIRLVTTDEDNKRLKTELSEMKARHRLEIERVTREKEQEMEEVHKRFVGNEWENKGLAEESLRLALFELWGERCYAQNVSENVTLGRDILFVLLGLDWCWDHSPHTNRVAWLRMPWGGHAMCVLSCSLVQARFSRNFVFHAILRFVVSLHNFFKPCRGAFQFKLTNHS